jgi:hypothetical protein
LELILKELKQLQLDGIKIGEQQLGIQFKLGGDLFFIAHMMGINNANSKHPCPWCSFNAKKTIEINKEWPISRSHEESKKKLLIPPTKKKKKNDASVTDTQTLGYKYEPIIDFISYDNVVVDVLHLLLRVSEKIFVSLIKKINVLEGNIDSADFKNRPILKHFFDVLSNFCKVYKPFTIVNVPGKEKEIKMRSLNGNETLRIFETLSKDGMELSNFFSDESEDNEFVTKFPNFKIEDFDNENYVWLHFYQLFSTIKGYNEKPEIEKINELRKKLKDWLEHFLILSPGSIPPYVHIFVYHVPEMIERHLNLNFYNQQGLEKIGDFIKSYYFRSTNRNRKQKKYLHQLIEKRNRIEFFQLNYSRIETPKYKINDFRAGPPI